MPKSRSRGEGAGASDVRRSSAGLSLGYGVGEAVAKKVGVGRETARRWLVQADVNAGARPGVTTDDQAEIKKLKAEEPAAAGGHEILQAATIFFAGELDPRNR